jgi:error-prone DNA polymerase
MAVPPTLRSDPGAAGPAYAELHCHSNFSFLDGASHPEELVEEAARLGLAALALTDHDGFYGVVRFARAARGVGLRTIFGAELTLTPPGPGGGLRPPDGRGVRPPDGRGVRPPDGTADPPGEHLVVLAEGPVGHARLARAISRAQLAGEKGAPRATLEGLAEDARAGVHLHPAPSVANDSWFVLTGCRKGTVPRALSQQGPAAARRALDRLVAAFGRDRVLVELWDHGDPLDRHRNDALAALAVRAGVGVVATNNVHYATTRRRPLATALAAIRARRSLDELDGWLPASPLAHLRGPGEQTRRFARWPGAVARTVEVADACAFDLRHAAPNLPDFGIPPGHTEMTWLRELVHRGAARRYPPSHPHHAEALRRIRYELAIVESLDFPGYFLAVHDIVEFCHREGIYCQGRGSAANSAVCFALGVTKADAVELGLIFERFLSPERDGPPDIDLDIENGRREEVIQYVFEKYGRERTAQVANVITYRTRSALREMARACGMSPGQADAITKHLDGWSRLSETGRRPGDLGPFNWYPEGAPHHDPAERQLEADGVVVPDLVIELARQVDGFPRHLGIHSGGMVMADRPLVEYCPIEWARMENRSVLQWDKDDCAVAGLVKFDLLGLGILTAMHHTVDLIRLHRGVEIDLAAIPQEDAVYDMLCDADTIGVFQVESRAQMATLPRLRPRTFYDLVIEVALIRPGPIQGNSVHPYLRRRRGEEPVTYLHPLLESSLAKTLGVPLFQEQLMQMAIDVAGFTPAEADELRQAMGSKRSQERMARMRQRLLAGMAVNGITGPVADEIAHKLEAFSKFGFPESHSVSFAYIVYSSAWLKLHHPAEFAAGLLNAQPMGFYSPHTLVRDARRHGVVTRGPDVNASRRDCTLEPRRPDDPGGLVGHPQPGWHADPSTHAIRTGLRYVRNLGDALLDRIEAARAEGPFAGLEDFTRRTGAPTDALEALATAGAFQECFGVGRRAALWAAGALRDARVGKLPGFVFGVEAPPLPGMTETEELSADLWAMGLSPGRHPTELVRPLLAEHGILPASALRTAGHGRLVEVAGVVTHRQHPETAMGTTFLNLEDETGLVNVICPKGVWDRFRRVARTKNLLVVRGVVEHQHDVVNLLAGRIRALAEVIGDAARLAAPRSRDFR